MGRFFEFSKWPLIGYCPTGLEPLAGARNRRKATVKKYDKTRYFVFFPWTVDCSLFNRNFILKGYRAWGRWSNLYHSYRPSLRWPQPRDRPAVRREKPVPGQYCEQADGVKYWGGPQDDHKYQGFDRFVNLAQPVFYWFPILSAYISLYLLKNIDVRLFLS